MPCPHRGCLLPCTGTSSRTCPDPRNKLLARPVYSQPQVRTGISERCHSVLHTQGSPKSPRSLPLAQGSSPVAFRRCRAALVAQGATLSHQTVLLQTTLSSGLGKSLQGQPKILNAVFSSYLHRFLYVLFNTSLPI